MQRAKVTVSRLIIILYPNCHYTAECHQMSNKLDKKILQSQIENVLCFGKEAHADYKDGCGLHKQLVCDTLKAFERHP